jgi:alkylation response protein AidB-like acyl-CoA dehydrogenase
MVETALLLDEMGRAACPGPYLPTMLAGHAILTAGSTAQKNRWLPAIANGSARATVALMERELDWDPQATAARRAQRQRLGADGVKQFVPWPSVADVMLRRRALPGALLFLVPASARARPLHDDGHRPHLQLGQVTLDGGRRRDTCWAPRRRRPLLDDCCVAERGRLREMLGAARRCPTWRCRTQGARTVRPAIGSFQAIRHRCAEMLLEVEKAHVAVYYAAWALSAGAEDATMAASVCKSFVSEAARQVCGDAIQVHGGIGFTWEYDLHLYFKRAKALEPLYGDAAYHRELLVRGLTASA